MDFLKISSGRIFLGQVSFVRDSGRIVFLEVVSKLFGIFRVGRKKIESGSFLRPQAALPDNSQSKKLISVTVTLSISVPYSERGKTLNDA